MDFLTVFTLYFSLALVRSNRAAHRAFSAFSFSRFFGMLLKLALVGYAISPPRIRYAAAFAAGDFCPTSIFFVVQMMFFLKINSVRIF